MNERIKKLLQETYSQFGHGEYRTQELVAEKLGSKKMRDMQDKLYDYEQVLKSWEDEINWDVKNPLI